MTAKQYLEGLIEGMKLSTIPIHINELKFLLLLLEQEKKQ